MRMRSGRITALLILATCATAAGIVLKEHPVSSHERSAPVVSTQSDPRDASSGAANAYWPSLLESCWTDNPYYATSKFEWQDPSSGPDPAIIAFRDSPGDTHVHRPTDRYLTLATQDQVGTVYGLATDWRRGRVFAGGFYKRYGQYVAGPDKELGRVYQVDLTTGEATVFAALVAGVAEGDGDQVGRIGLGDIDLDDEATTLFVVNLLTRRIHALSTADGTELARFDHGAAGESWAEDARPFGLGYDDGWLYHGVVNTRESDLLGRKPMGHVYRSRPDGSAMTEVARFDLDYTRPQWMGWVKWSHSIVDTLGLHPLISDIEFRPNGDPIIGLASRQALNDFTTTYGDVLPTERVGAAEWRVITDPEFYEDRYSDPVFWPEVVDEATQGQLAAVPRRDAIVTLSLLLQPHSGGGYWLDNTTGQVSGPENGTEHLWGEEMAAGDVESLCHEDMPTPTPTPTNTPLPSPTATPTATATATQTATVTPEPRPIFLPVAARRDCLKRVYVDVVLVMDASTSMARSTSSGAVKAEAAADAARLLTGLLNLTPDAVGRHDRVAIVGFNDDAWIQQRFSGDQAALSEALAALEGRMAEGTRLDLALERAGEALAGRQRQTRNQPVVVLLTDGLPNRVPRAEDGTMETTVVRASDALKQRGALVFTIGVGDTSDIHPQLLRRVASDPSHYLYAPDAADLAAIYATIARTVGCP